MDIIIIYPVHEHFMAYKLLLIFIFQGNKLKDTVKKKQSKCVVIQIACNGVLVLIIIIFFFSKKKHVNIRFTRKIIKTHKNGWLINHKIAVNGVIPHLLALDFFLYE